MVYLHVRCMIKIINSITKSHFIRSVSLLSGSTVIAHIIAVITAPILSRLYTPEDFGVLAVFTTILSVISVVASLRYETALPLPDNESTALNLLGFGFLCIFAMTVLISLILVVFGNTISALLNVPALKNYLWLLPLCFIGAGVYQILTYWAIRQNSYKTLAASKIYKISAQVGVPIPVGLFKSGPFGLILGDFISRFAGSGLLINHLLPNKIECIKKIRFKTMFASAKEYKRYPKYASLSILIHTINLQLPILFFSIIYGSQVAGWFSFGQRIFVAPLNIIGAAIGQVFYGKASTLARQNSPELRKAFIKITLILSLLFLMPVFVVTFWGAEIFAFILGDVWEQVGVYLQISSFSIYAMMVIGPVYQILNILQKQHLILLSVTLCLISIITAFYVVYKLNLKPESAVLFYSISLFFCYSLFFVFSLNSMKY